ncbi:MAG: hypothetical protein OXP75_14805 [Rhodospirillales bacterium]|nr:hypothetical protein [Rhodospirillales bacterium]
MPAVQQSVEDLEVIYDKVQADSRFSLYYLREVDAAIEAAAGVRNDAQTAERAIKQFLAQLAETGGGEKPIDPADRLATISAAAEAAVKKTIRVLQGYEGAWKGASISTEHAEEVSEGNREAIIALQNLHDSMVDLRWAVTEHDADLEVPEGEAFDNVEDLVADLSSR